MKQVGYARNWSREEIQTLEDLWGRMSVKSIAKNLNRPVGGVINKVARRGLGRFLECGDYITLNQLFNALGRTGGSSYTLNHWMNQKGLPVRYQKRLNDKVKVINIEDFWKWAKEYRMHIDFSKVEENILGLEPEWVKDQRRADIEFAKYKLAPWTKEEDTHLHCLLKLYKYTYREMSIKILRTEGAIKRRVVDLVIMERPLREDPHSKWSEEQENIVIEMYNKGYRSTVIKEYIEKSEQAISGKIERLIKGGYLIKWK